MIKRHSQGAIVGLDALRGLAIILMFITHGFRLFLESNPQESSVAFHFLQFFALIEPFTSALFLFLVGIGLRISFAKTTKSYSSWLKSNLGKSGILYLLGIGLFFGEYGIQWPDIVLAPSILSVIALSIILVSLGAKHSIRFYSLGILVAVISQLSEGGAGVAGINMGPGGAFPLILFTFLGYETFRLYETKSWKSLIGYLAGGIICWVWPYSFYEQWTNVYHSSYQVFGSGVTGLDFLSTGGKATQVISEGFWNHTLISVGRIYIPLVFSLLVCLTKNNLLSTKLYGKLLALLGRHALGNYVLHLGLIALFSVLKWYPSSAIQDWLFIGGLTVAGLVYSKYQDAKLPTPKQHISHN